MSQRLSNPTSPGFKRYSREGFQPLNDIHIPHGNQDATINIPMQDVSGQTSPSPLNEKASVYNRRSAGFRRSFRPGTRPAQAIDRPHAAIDPDDGRPIITKMGKLYDRFFNFSIFTRYAVYVVPFALILAVPIIIGATAAKTASIGGVRIVWFFSWILTSWGGLWASKIFAHYLPRLFQAVCGVVSSGTRKYASVLASLEIPISLVGWALVSLATFMPLMTRNPDQRAHPFKETPHWMSIMSSILAAALISTLILLLERSFIQLISINYHRTQFNQRIQSNKRNVFLLGLLYDASRAMFPVDCPEFVEEDAVVANTLDILRFGSPKKAWRKSHFRSGSATPLRMMREVGNFGNKLTSAINNVAHEVTGKDYFNGNSAHSIVVEALERNRSAEALAKRIWLSFVIEGNEALFQDDIVEVLGAERQVEAEEAFGALDRDGNGDISLDEMILVVTQWGRERHAIANSMHDVDQAINVLDNLLMAVVFVAVVFIFVAFLNRNFVTTLATAGTALLSLSFVFSVTAQEVLGSCIFLFVKHPFDIGDRVDINKEALVVEKISLLFTAFRRVTNHQMVQIPNIVLNTLWIENVSRSKAQREQVSSYIDFATSFEDIQLLKTELQKFVTEKDNSRDFYPDVDVQVLSLAEMNKLEIQINVIHKSNWSNESVRAARRSKLMCALLATIRRIPINAPGGGGPGLGDAANPSYSVAISPAEAGRNKADKDEKKEAARLIPTKKSEPTWIDQLAPRHEQKAMTALNERSPAIDPTRDDDGDNNLDVELPGDSVAGSSELMRQKSKGRRKSGRTGSTKSIGASTIASLHRGSYPEVPRIGINAPSLPAPSLASPSSFRYPPSAGPTPTRSPAFDRPGTAHSDHSHERGESYESLHAVPPPPPAPPAGYSGGMNASRSWRN